MKEFFLIGEVAKLFGINIRLLRYYDDISLLKPAYTDPQTGYRYYSTLQFEPLNTILYLRALNVPIPKIKLFLDHKDSQQMVEILKEQQAVIEEQKRKLELIQRKIETRLSGIYNASNTTYGQLEEYTFPDRPIAMLKKDIPVTDDLEYSIRELDKKEQLGSIVFLGKVGVSIAESNLKQRKFDSFSSIFVLLENEDNHEKTTDKLPAGTYLTIRFQGTHKNSVPYYHQMLDYMKQHHYEPLGDSIEITLMDYGMTTDPSKFATEIQIPYQIHSETPR